MQLPRLHSRSGEIAGCALHPCLQPAFGHASSDHVVCFLVAFRLQLLSTVGLLARKTLTLSAHDRAQPLRRLRRLMTARWCRSSGRQCSSRADAAGPGGRRHCRPWSGTESSPERPLCRLFNCNEHVLNRIAAQRLPESQEESCFIVSSTERRMKLKCK